MDAKIRVIQGKADQKYANESGMRSAFLRQTKEFGGRLLDGSVSDIDHRPVRVALEHLIRILNFFVDVVTHTVCSVRRHAQTLKACLPNPEEGISVDAQRIDLLLVHCEQLGGGINTHHEWHIGDLIASLG